MTAREYLNTKMYWIQDDIPVNTVTPEDIIEWLEGYAEAVKNNAVSPLVSERTWTVDEIVENLRPFESANNAAQWFNMYGR